MCVIIAKQKEDRLPTTKELVACFNTNPDGAGFMYLDNGQVVIDKGYMKFKDFYNRYKELCLKYNNFKDLPLVIHLRIGTSGGNVAMNTHPYPISNKVADIHTLYMKTDVGVAHNGVISDYYPEGDDYNDTAEYIMSWMYNVTKFDKKFYTRRYYQDMMRQMTYSKFAFLDKSGEIYTVGDFKEVNGLSFSNLNHLPFAERQKYEKSYSYGYSKWGQYGWE
jgi:predicted glutamine amidotransferase